MRNRHNLSHRHTLSTDMGWMVPIFCAEVLPGDTFIQSTNLVARVAPLANPVMHTVRLQVDHWYMPTRVVWPPFENWITGADAEAVMPKITVPAIDSANNNALFDYLGIPPQAAGVEIQAPPIRMYNGLYNHRYRDQEVMEPVAEDQTQLLRPCWQKDYFTTCRPNPQQGVPAAAQIQFQADVPVMGIGYGAGATGVVSQMNMVQSDGQTVSRPAGNTPSGGMTLAMEMDALAATRPNVRIAAGSLAGTITMDELRKTAALQRFQEARMRFGDRYEDYLRWLGVNPSTGRLDRPEYLGGGRQTINFSEVLATAEGTNTTVGDMYGHGIAGLRSRRYRKMFEEHGFVMTILTCRPDTMYQDGIPRQFQRFDPMDYWQKEMEILPWQEVMSKELHYAAPDTTIFGYQQRNDEYRHCEDRVSGTFRRGETEADWHMGREFESAPLLNPSFLECTPTDRIYSDKSMPELLISARHNIQAKRLVSMNAKFGTNSAL